MNKNELKEGEIYTHDNGNIVKFEYLNKYGYACGKFFIGGNCDRFNNNLLNSTGAFTTFNLKEATPKEKHWLKTCIKLDKFVSKEEAMKSFPKEVIKVKPFDVLSFKGIGPHNQGLYNKEDSLYRFESSNSRHSLGNLLYLDSKVIINSVINEEGNIFMIDDTITTIEGVNKGKGFKIIGFRLNKAKTMICAITDSHFNGVGIDKIEHYIEKEEFALPEKWCIVRNLDNCSTINNWFINNQIKNWIIGDNKGYLHSTILNGDWIDSNNKKEGYVEITFEQFKKYVLKEEQTFENFGKKVDEIIIAQSNSDQLKLKQVGIDSIVIHNETLLEKAKRLYPIGTKYKEYRGTIYTVINQSFSVISNTMIYGERDKGCIFYKNKWAEIIEEVKVGDKFRFNQHNRGDFIVDKIQDSNDGKIIFYKTDNNYDLLHNRVLLKNITIIK